MAKKRKKCVLTKCTTVSFKKCQPIRDPNPNPSTYSSRAEKGQTEQDENAGVRLAIQNWDLRIIFSEKKLLQDNEKV